VRRREKASCGCVGVRKLMRLDAAVVKFGDG